MFISLTLTITLLTAAQAWLYDGATPVDCIEDWGPWRCAGNKKQYRENIIFRHPTVNGAPCVNGRIEFNENSCEPTLDDKTRSVEKFWLNHDNGFTSGSRSGRESGLKRDILILLDMSGSISTTAFNEVKVDISRFIGLICPAGDLGRGRTNQLALVAFSDRIVRVFDFNDHYNLAVTQNAIRNFQRQGTNTHTKQALEYVRRNMFGSQGLAYRGLRRDSNHEVILITDGQPTDASEVEVEQEAQRLKNMGVEVFGFGIDETQAINFEHLNKVVSPKDTSHVFHIKGVQEFTAIVEIIRAQAESPHNTGQCIDLGYYPDQ
ncbi:PREDICTED: cartilage matrix protein-like [Branchiostoma belcheri]|uniref:Cartilage matrix protein-like n=1 Tax=Branchiostoma belcheri TaxID=7741 RepID=A0A6P4YVA7_BRABE|nr:PREDICTED: cartilage matrix protein-like [Branchiostoma belcheri]